MALSMIFLASSSLRGAEGQCTELNEAERHRLVAYVQKKYKTPPRIPLTLTEIPQARSDCFRKLRFSAGDASRFQIELFASPNLRFLTRDLMDSRVDPVEEEQRRQKTLLAGLTTGKHPTMGLKDAPVTITMFSDFQCPFCAQLAKRMATDILPLAGEHVRVVFRNFPLAMHPWARDAAESAACAQLQGDAYFWQLHDFIFDHQRDLTPDSIRKRIAGRAAELPKFDIKEFNACVSERRTSSTVDQDLAFGREVGIAATPTLFVNTQQLTGFHPEQILTLIRQISRDSKRVNPSGAVR